MNKVITSLKVLEHKLGDASRARKKFYPTIRELAWDLAIGEGLAYKFFNGKSIGIKNFKRIAESINLSWHELSNYQKCSRVMSSHWSSSEERIKEITKYILGFGSYIVIVGHYPIDIVISNESIHTKLVRKNCQILILTQKDSNSDEMEAIALLVNKNVTQVKQDCQRISVGIKKAIHKIESLGGKKFVVEKTSLVSLSWHGIFTCVKQNGIVKLDPSGVSLIINASDSFSLDECLIQIECNRKIIENQNKLVESIDNYIN